MNSIIQNNIIDEYFFGEKNDISQTLYAQLKKYLNSQLKSISHEQTY